MPHALGWLILIAASLSPAEKHAFRLWFTFLAEAQIYNEPAVRPAEIRDCSALVRYAYREALARHDADWRRRNPLPAPPALPPNPYLPPPHFRTPQGRAHFADASTLLSHNARPVGQSFSRAQPGDLLFFQQIDDANNWHVMVYLGPSHFESAPGPWVIYHTGPVGRHPGELRRLTLQQLLEHPQPRWRPVPGNAAFRGIYRLRLLEE
ncbi:MAG: DUF1175 family protein [Bryobacter sp.]|nr:DUF1175 family protein [Bryobacter sp.]